MAGDVTPFRPRDRSGFMTGEAFCLHCGHRWVAVVPQGADWLECPECGTEKGLLRFHAELPEGALMRVCECGNSLFYITQEAHLCPNCGLYQRYE